jgi:hypothetical protein
MTIKNVHTLENNNIRINSTLFRTNDGFMYEQLKNIIVTDKQFYRSRIFEAEQDSKKTYHCCKCKVVMYELEIF